MAVLEVEFASYSLKRSVTFNALIPTDRNFQPNGETRFEMGPFRTLYMLHGYTGAGRDYLFMTNIIRQAGPLGLAVVFPNGENSFYLEDAELGISHSRLVGKELVDFSRKMFPLSTRREDTFIGGISMGGYGALVTGLRYPDTFSKILSLSGAFIELDIADRKTTLPDGISGDAFQRRIFGDPENLRYTDRDPRFLIERLRREGKEIPKISMCCGSDDFLIGPNRKLNAFLDEKGVEHLYEEGAGSHDWDYWLPRLPQGLEWLAGP